MFERTRRRERRMDLRILLICFVFVSCKAVHPPEPRWQELSDPPFVGKQNGNYVVTAEYVKLSEQRRVYIERVRKNKEKRGQEAMSQAFSAQSLEKSKKVLRFRDLIKIK